MAIPTETIKTRAVAGQRSAPDLYFATKSMTYDLDLKVSQVDRDGM